MFPALGAGRSRARLIIAAVALFIFWKLYGSWGSVATSEWDFVVQRMNSDVRGGKPSQRTRSSFDWSSVKLEHAPKTIKSLPKGQPKRMTKIQHDFPPESEMQAQLREQRRNEVRELFQKNWKSYRKYAWMKDALQPLSASYKDQFSGWAATLVDALDTLWIMGLREEFDEAVEAVSTIDFGKSSTGRVNSFETTIRYLGGLLAAYDLSGRGVLLQKAIELGDMLYAGFNTPNHMPCDFIDFEKAKTGRGLQVEGTVVSASPGTLSMEMTRLSQITGDSKYYDATNRVMEMFAEQQGKSSIPGMWPIMVSMSRMDVKSGNKYTLGGSADSLYEYLPKMWLLTGGLDAKYGTMSHDFMEAADKHFFFRPMLPDRADILISGNAETLEDGSIYLDPETEHLACFIGGIFGVGGRVFDRPDWVTTGSKLTHGCVNAYKSMPTGMGPERWNHVACKSRTSCNWDEQEWEAGKAKRPEWKQHLPKGFTTAKDPRYILRPEAIESVFVMWRITGKKEFQEAGWDMFKAVAKGTATEYANAAVLDVTKASKDGLPQEDYMEVRFSSPPPFDLLDRVSY